MAHDVDATAKHPILPREPFILPRESFEELFDGTAVDSAIAESTKLPGNTLSDVVIDAYIVKSNKGDARASATLADHYFNSQNTYLAITYAIRCMQDMEKDESYTKEGLERFERAFELLTSNRSPSFSANFTKNRMRAFETLLAAPNLPNKDKIIIAQSLAYIISPSARDQTQLRSLATKFDNAGSVSKHLESNRPIDAAFALLHTHFLDKNPDVLDLNPLS